MQKIGPLFFRIMLAIVFILFLAGCNSESSSSKTSVSGSPSSESTSSGSSDISAGKKAPDNGTEDPAYEDPDDGDLSNEDPIDEDPAEDPDEKPLAEKGTLALFLADATTDYQAVYVTISEVQVCAQKSAIVDPDADLDAEIDEDVTEDGCQWITVGEPGQTYNLLELINGVVAQLGIVELEAGYYSQLRMILGKNPDSELNLLGYEHLYPNYIIDGSGQEISLTVPSGYQTGIKLVSGFDIIAGASTELVLDFDAARSVVKAGKSGKYLLKPTIKVINTINRADLNGMVADQEGTGIPGAFVSAQIYSEGSVDEGIEPTVEVFTTTQTNADGGYMLYLPPGDYNIVAYKGAAEGESTAYGPGCITLEADFDFMYNENFTLDLNETGTLAVDIDVIPDQTISISAWMVVECGGSPVLIEVPTPLVVNAQVQSERHEMILPEGIYTILAAIDGTALREIDVEIAPGVETVLAFNFLGSEPDEVEDDDLEEDTEEDDDTVEGEE